MPQLVYFDTDVYHRAGDTFADRPLAEDLRDRIVLSPITLMEVLTHLTLRDTEPILRQIQAMRNWVNPQRASVLPWGNAAIAALGFGMPLPPDDYFERISQAIQTCLYAESANQLREPAGLLKDALDRLKANVVVQFKRLVESYRRIPMTDGDFEEVFVHGLRQRVPHAPDTPVCDVVTALGAYCEFERDKLRVAAANETYRAEDHGNDLLDVEQLVYLADPRLCFLTCDGGYLRRVNRSPQRERIHVAPVAVLADHDAASHLIRELMA